MTADLDPDRSDADHPGDLWSWVDADPEPLGLVPTGDVVTAVLVVHNGGTWLADALTSLAALDEVPGRLLVVDNGSTDAGRDLLAAQAAAGRLTLVQGQATWGFGRGVAEALATVEPTEWLWLLHDDVVVHREALRRLLEQTARTPDADVLGPMLLRPSRRTQASRILELGVSISHTGRRELGLEPGEVAQGQHEPADTLGVSTCGMLVRRSTYEALGGFDEAVPLFRDGVEFGWRATLAGHRVVTCPAARITHRQAGRLGRRTGTLAEVAGRSPGAFDRLMAMRTVSAHAHGVVAAGVRLRLVLGSLLRALGYLVGKRPDLSAEEMQACGDFLRSGAAVRALRGRVAALRPTVAARRRVARLRPHRWSSWAVGLDAVARSVSERLRGFTSGGDEVTLDELTGDDFADRSSRQRRAVLPVAATVALVLGVLVANRRVAGLGDLVASGLLPAPDTLGTAVRAYLAESGNGGDHPAWLGLAALASVPFVVPGWATAAAVLLGVPAAALACAWYLEPSVTGVRTRWVAALVYALLPVLVGGYSRGQVWLVVWAVVLPAFGVALRSWGTARGLEGWRAPAGGALALIVLASITPLALPVGAALLVGVAVRRREGVAKAAVAVAATVGMLLPWVPALVRHPGRLVTGPEPLLGSLAVSPAWEIVAGRSAGPGLPPLWLSLVVAGLLWVAALVALALRPTAWGVWAGALGCLTLAAGLSRAVVTVAGGPARPEVTMWLVAGLGLLVAGSAIAVDRARLDLSESDFGIGQALVVASSVVGVVALVLSAGWWVWGGVGAPLARSGSSVPAYVRDAEVAQASRALLVRIEPGAVTWFVDEPGRPRWGDGETGVVLGGSSAAVPAARTVVAQLASGRQVEGLAGDLARLGISHVRVGGTTPDVLAALNATPGLQRGTDDPAGAVWIVTGKPSRLQVVAGSEVSYVAGAVPPGPSGRLLILADGPAERRTVTVGGAPLAPAASPDWRAAYELGAAAGPVVIGATGSSWWAWLQLSGLALLAVFAAPSLQRETDTVQPVARRASATAEEAR